VILNDILQPTHLLLILVAALLVLGPRRLPEATRSIGRGIHDFKSAIAGDSPRGGGRVTADAAGREPGERTV
jgi:sec-independent protein translocase protein TatA